MAQQLNFTDRQAQAILEMRLYKLIGLEIEALMKEHDETLENIAKYEDILEHRSSMAKVIIKELTAFKKAYGKERKTVIDNLKEAVVAAKKIEEQDVVFLMDRFGYAKIVDTSVYERNKEAANAEYRHIFTCKNTDKICIFTDKGQMHLLKVLDLPYGNSGIKEHRLTTSAIMTVKKRMLYIWQVLNMSARTGCYLAQNMP